MVKSSNRQMATASTSSSSSSETMSDDGYSFGLEDDGSDPWGWYGSISVDQEYHANVAIRAAWLEATSFQQTAKSVSKKKCIILNSWTNPNPSMSIKASEEDLKPLKYAMNTSACINGFRIVQLVSGEVRAEFEMIFCYGSRSYSSWKSFQEFKELATIAQHIHMNKFPIFKRSLKEWKFINDRKRWLRCLNISYLIEKSICLGNFIQCLLLESPSPGLLLCFVQNTNFVA